MLTKEQESNLRIFLSRVDLKGNEMQAFNEVLTALFGPPIPVASIVDAEVIPESKEEPAN